MPVSRLLTALVLAAAVVLVGCGRRGPLDTPYQAKVDARKEAERNKEPLPPEPTPPVADKPFILDGLL
ncbi:MAG: lipoprotein [Rhizobiaceae bacterium]